METQTKQVYRWVPKDSDPIEHELGIAYVYETPRGFAVVAYAGRAGKASFHKVYRKAEQRDNRVARFFRGLEQHALLVAERKSERSKSHTLTVGTILHHSWGYDQTNCDYYQVISVTEHGATIREIASRTVPSSEVSHGMADKRVAVKDQFCGEPIKVRVRGDNYIHMSKGALSHGSVSVWDGKPNYCSWYA